MACCQGTEIDLKEMRTEGQKDAGEKLWQFIRSGMNMGATPFEGQLSQGSDPAQMAAMNTMMGIGGYGPYTGGGGPGNTAPSLGGYVFPGPPVNQGSIINANPNPYPDTAPGPPDTTVTSTVTSKVNSTTLPGTQSGANPVTVMANTYDPPMLPTPGPTLPGSVYPVGNGSVQVNVNTTVGTRVSVGGNVKATVRGNDMDSFYGQYYDPYRSR